MTDVQGPVLEKFVRDCRRIGRRGLVRCSSGNLSLRIEDDRFLVTSSRSWMEDLSPKQVSLCRVSDGALLDGGRPSVETGFHAGILRTRPDVNVVLHFQTPCATALACQGSADVNYLVIPEIPFYIGHIGHVPYLSPGSEELADAVIEAMRDHDLAVLANHGQVTVAGDMDHAIQNAEFFELACEVILRSGGKAVPLPEEAVNTLLAPRRSADGGSDVPCDRRV